MNKITCVKIKKTRDEIACKEATANPIFLFQVRRTIEKDVGFWDTIGVFASREEGETFGENHTYRYGSFGKGIDWRVYCIPLERYSELANILRKVGLNE